jgi:hypothetical protein
MNLRYEEIMWSMFFLKNQCFWSLCLLPSLPCGSVWQPPCIHRSLGSVPLGYSNRSIQCFWGTFTKIARNTRQAGGFVFKDFWRYISLSEVDEMKIKIKEQCYSILWCFKCWHHWKSGSGMLMCFAGKPRLAECACRFWDINHGIVSCPCSVWTSVGPQLLGCRTVVGEDTTFYIARSILWV